jgi:hypothetical protein
MGLRDLWGRGLRVGSLLALAGACSMIGCSQSATEGGNGGSSNAGGGSSGASPASALHPPATIDLVGCSSFLSPDGPGCSMCCHAAGFMNAGFPLDDRCVCGPYGGPETTVCASQLSGQASCAGCCATAGYKAGTWTSGVSCACNIKQDVAVCASATQAADSCVVCCLNHGYLGHDEPAGPAGGCVCSE